MLTDEQIDVLCYQHGATVWEETVTVDVIRAAYRLGLTAGAKLAAEYCDAVAHDYTQEGNNEAAATVLEVALDLEEQVLAKAIRAEAGE